MDILRFIHGPNGSQRFFTRHKILLCSATRKKVTRCSSSYAVINYSCLQGQYSEPVNTNAGQDTEGDQMKLEGITPTFMTTVAMI